MGYGGNGEHAARPPALFVLELGANGGTLAPTTIHELLAWIEKEQQIWQPFYPEWQKIFQGRNPAFGNLKIAVDWVIQPLKQAHALVQKIASNEKLTEADNHKLLQQIERHLKDAFVTRWLPHTGSPQGKRMLGLMAEPVVALGYVFSVIADGHNQLFTQGNATTWRGFLLGLQDRHGVITDTEGRLDGEKEALGDLRAKAEDAITHRSLAADDLHRRYEALVADVALADEQQKQNFQVLLDHVNQEHAKAQSAYATDMSDLKRAFKEAMALRGPVSYWRKKARKHRVQGRRQMVQSFRSLGGLAIGLGLTAIWAFWTVNDKGVPDAWKVSVLILIAVLGIWATRLLIRLWLSNAHLATDAEERVTMVQTYLALIEDGKMTKDEDRALVLTPLFRPAVDGLVKDEGLPHPMLEILTRSGRN
jgi:heme/copper-type cytochrome/quinol oxidase subunit 4